MRIDVEVTNSQNERVGSLPFESLLCTKRHQAGGAASLVTVASDTFDRLTHPQAGIVVNLDGAPGWWSGRVRRVEHHRTADSHLLDVRADGDWDLLEGRIIWPQPDRFPPWTQGQWTQSSALGAADAIVELVDAQMGATAYSHRRVPNISFDQQVVSSTAVLWPWRFETVARAVAEYAGLDQLTVELAGNVLTVKEPAEIARPFTETDTSEYRVWIAAPDATNVLAGGEGDLLNRVLAFVEDSAARQHWGWNESFLDVANQSDPNEVAQAAASALSDAAREGSGFEMALSRLDVEGSVFGQDWDVGDWLTVDLPGFDPVRQRVEQVTLDVAGANPPNVSVVAGRTVLSPSAKTLQEVRRGLRQAANH
ncbi:MAG: hypothetical protein GEU73_07675 [Chloroflexi bacterium]|nr:hypothetical protein [Chloroflexota bacterium]